MKRDMDLIRAILLELEEKSTGLGTDDVKVEGYDAAQIGYHCALIVEAGLAQGTDVTSMHSEHPEWSLGRLTWLGHEFLEASREPSRWEKAKEISRKAGGLTLSMMLDVLKQLMSDQVGKLIT